MAWIERFILIASYPLLVAARLAGRDPLRLREPRGSCWVERPARPAASSYFYGGSPADRVPAVTHLLMSAARLLQRRSGTPPGHGGEDIPDEIYTLW